MEKRSIYALLSKPMRRGELVLGKYCGLVLTLAINVVVMTIALYAVLAYMGWAGDRAAVMVVTRASDRSGDAEGDRPDHDGADARHRDRAVLLDVLEPVPLGDADRGTLGDRSFQ